MREVNDATLDHPRGRGEHSCWYWDPESGSGSSPRMRGALGGPFGIVISAGIIPADAGSTTLWVPPVTIRRDHPRGCGEHLLD